ncbi:MAG: hypothetical protein AAB884_02675 [Patescibacteria group bacterium]
MNFHIFKQKTLLVLSIISGAFFLFSFLLIVLNIGGFGSPVILHYDVFRGIDLFGDKFDVWAIWITGFLLGILNIILSNTFFYRERVLSYLFIAVNLLISILILVVSGVIVSVN